MLRTGVVVLLAAALLCGLAWIAAAAAGKPPAARGVVSGPLGEKADAYVSRLEGYGFAGSILVAKDGQIVLHKGYGLADREKKIPFTPETVYDICSIAKSFTAAAILKLKSAGKLKVTDPIGKYFDGVPEDKAGITLHHLLTHSAGLGDSFGGDYDEMSRDQLVQKVLASELRRPPGTRFDYSNASYSLLAAIVEKVSGQPFETYLRDQLFRPAGMEKTGYRLPAWKPEELARGYRGAEPWGSPLDHPWAPDGPWWNLRGNGGILSTTGDLYKWHQALEKGTVLSREAQAKATTPYVPVDDAGTLLYGYGWGMNKSPGGTPRISKNGGNQIFTADFQRFPDDRMVLIVGASQADFSAIFVARHLAHVLFGNEIPLPPAVAPLDPAALAKLVGAYEVPGGGRLVVTTGPTIPGRPTGVVIRPEGQGAFATLAGAGAADRERYAAMEAQIVQALDAMRKDDFKPLHLLYGQDQPLEQVAARNKESWSSLEQKNGPFQKLEILGTAPLGPGRAVTWVRFSFARGTEFMGYYWQGPAVGDVRFAQEPPSKLFLPAGPGELAAIELRSGEISRVRFETGEAGVAALVVGETRAKRM